MRNATLALGLGLGAAILAGCAASGGQPAEQGVDPNYDTSKAKAVKLTQTSRGAMVTVDARVLFDTGKAEVKSDGLVALDRIAALVKDKSKADVVVEGHTDNVGSVQLNQRLSEQRAVNVKNGLIQRGVPAARIVESKGLGFGQPVADNSTEEGRAQNRRVEVLMLNESAERIGGKAEEERLASGLDKFLKSADEFVRGVFDRISGTEKKPQ